MKNLAVFSCKGICILAYNGGGYVDFRRRSFRRVFKRLR